jgi:penicillin-insensitive murein DD-endopeptidase
LRFVRPLFLSLALTLPMGCFGSPTPLAPGLRGSVGLPSHGVLTDAAELPISGEGFRRFRPLGTRNFGTPLLVSAVMRAAFNVERLAPGGAPLLVGDLSARVGGKISGHASHRTGRDVDLLYYATTLDGIPESSPGFVHFGSDGLAQAQTGGYIRLDARRIWLLIRSLLEDPEAEILWIFASRDVKAFVIDYARSVGEPPVTIARAIRVLHQPRDSANHDDHLHVRIACSLDERAAGCEPGGPAWPWLRTRAEGDASLIDEMVDADRDSLI